MILNLPWLCYAGGGQAFPAVEDDAHLHVGERGYVSAPRARQIEPLRAAVRAGCRGQQVQPCPRAAGRG